MQISLYIVCHILIVQIFRNNHRKPNLLVKMKRFLKYVLHPYLLLIVREVTLKHFLSYLLVPACLKAISAFLTIDGVHFPSQPMVGNMGREEETADCPVNAAWCTVVIQILGGRIFLSMVICNTIKGMNPEAVVALSI